MIPLPNFLYNNLSQQLQLISSEVGVWVIRQFGISVFLAGNVIDLGAYKLQVVEACSGLRSIITLLTLSIILGYFFLQKLSSKLILALISIPVAIIVNVFRVTIMVLAYHFFQLDLVDGPLHSAVGIGVFIVSLILLFAVERGLEQWEKESIKS